MKMAIYTISEARANLHKLVEHIHLFHEPVYIVGEKNKAVLLSEEDYRSMMEALHHIPIQGSK
jgi:antitoxin YefM